MHQGFYANNESETSAPNELTIYQLYQYLLTNFSI